MACEKCWNDAYMRARFYNPEKSQAEHYTDLLEERKDKPCTMDEQLGYTKEETKVGE